MIFEFFLACSLLVVLFDSLVYPELNLSDTYKPWFEMHKY